MYGALLSIGSHYFAALPGATGEPQSSPPAVLAHCLHVLAPFPRQPGPREHNPMFILHYFSWKQR